MRGEPGDDGLSDTGGKPSTPTPPKRAKSTPPDGKTGDKGGAATDTVADADASRPATDDGTTGASDSPATATPHCTSGATATLYGCRPGAFPRVTAAVTPIPPDKSYVEDHPAELQLGEAQWYQVLCHADDVAASDMLRAACSSWTPVYGLADGIDYVRHDDILPIAPGAVEEGEEQRGEHRLQDSPSQGVRRIRPHLPEPEATRFNHALYAQLFHTTLSAGPERVAVARKRPTGWYEATDGTLNRCTLWWTEAHGVTVQVLPMLVTTFKTADPARPYILVYKVGGQQEKLGSGCSRGCQKRSRTNGLM